MSFGFLVFQTTFFRGPDALPESGLIAAMHSIAVFQFLLPANINP
jgi:hypothetical protein